LQLKFIFLIESQIPDTKRVYRFRTRKPFSNFKFEFPAACRRIRFIGAAGIGIFVFRIGATKSRFIKSYLRFYCRMTFLKPPGDNGSNDRQCRPCYPFSIFLALSSLASHMWAIPVSLAVSRFPEKISPLVIFLTSNLRAPANSCCNPP
jgi:hypothetical protein